MADVSRGESRITQQETENGPVVVKRVAIGGWSCDACHTLGAGWADIEAHFERTEHRIYTEMR